MLDNVLPGLLTIITSLVSFLQTTMLIGQLSIFNFFVLLFVFSLIIRAFINGSGGTGGSE